jgi:hypothetical protein
MHIYCKYTETKLILLFNVIFLDFNAPVGGPQNRSGRGGHNVVAKAVTFLTGVQTVHA